MRAFARRLRRERYDAVLDLQGLTKSALVRLPGARAELRPGQSHRRREPRVAGALAGDARDPGRAAQPRARPLARAGGARARHRRPTARRPSACAAADVGGARPGADRLHPRHLARRQALARGELDRARPPPRRRRPADRPAARRRRGGGARAARIAAALGAAAEVWPALDLGAFIDRLAATGGAIGVDSGPSHIAVALDLPHVQIYNHPTAWRTGPQERHGHRHQVSIEGRPTPDGRRGVGRLAAGASRARRARRGLGRAGRAMSGLGRRAAARPRTRCCCGSACRSTCCACCGGDAPSRSTPPRSASASAATAAPCRRARSGSMRSRSARRARRRR